MLNEFEDFDEFFTDTVQIVEKRTVSDGQGGRETRTVGVGDMIAVFLDTPTANDLFLANQLQQETFDRYMYYTYGQPFKRGQEIQEIVDGVVVMSYKVVGKPEDQGGRKQFMRAHLKEV